MTCSGAFDAFALIIGRSVMLMVEAYGMAIGVVIVAAICCAAFRRSRSAVRLLWRGRA